MIQPGDVVCLKSDPKGQKFTAGRIFNASSNTITIYWFDNNSCEIKEKVINKECLVKN